MLLLILLETFTTLYLLWERVICWVWRQRYHNLLAGLRGKIPEFVPIAVQIQLINYRAEHCTTVPEHSPGPKANLDNGGFG